jgi:hypothetical protein
VFKSFPANVPEYSESTALDAVKKELGTNEFLEVLLYVLSSF